MAAWLDRLLGRAPRERVPERGTLGINDWYDALTGAVLRRVLEPGSNCIDVGCHEGAILEMMLAAAPRGRHFAFEPIPDMFAALASRYRDDARVTLVQAALSDAAGESTFHHVVSNPGYSGLKRRQYDRPHEDVTEIRVRTARMDDLIPADVRVRLVKIDVEGGEMQVMTGGLETLRRSRPYVVFEHGLGASEFYGTTPGAVYDLLAGCGLRISLLDTWLAGRAPFDRAGFEDEFRSGRNWYFLAHP